MIESSTARYAFQLPHPANNLSDDVMRLRSALSGIDGIIYTHQSTLAARLAVQSHWANTTAFTYDGSNRVATVTETYGLVTYVTTITYTGDLVTRVQMDGNGLRRTEDLTYDGNGLLTGVAATEAPL